MPSWDASLLGCEPARYQGIMPPDREYLKTGQPLHVLEESRMLLFVRLENPASLSYTTLRHYPDILM